MEIDPFDIYYMVVDTAILVLLVKWYFFDKKQSRKRPRKKPAIQVTVPTVIKVEKRESD